MLARFLLVAALVSLCESAFAESDRQAACASLLQDGSRNGLFAVYADLPPVRLNACDGACRAAEAQQLAYHGLEYFLYVYSPQSRFYPQGAGDDVVVAKSRTIGGGTANSVIVTRRNFPAECNAASNLYQFPDGRGMVDLGEYVSHHAPDGYGFDSVHRTLHFQLSVTDGQPTCVWTDGTADAREMFSFEAVRAGAVIAQRLAGADSVIADQPRSAGAEPRETWVHGPYSSLEAQLVYVPEADSVEKGCFFVESPLPSTVGGWWNRTFHPGVGRAQRAAAGWTPSMTGLSLERWQASARHPAARLEYLIAW